MFRFWEMKMNKTRLLIAASAIIASFAAISTASAETVRDHRKCPLLDPNCRDHRGPVVVVPPRPTPGGGTVIIDPIRPTRPHVPPVVVIDPMPQPQPPEPPHQPMQGDNFGISCKMGRNILRAQGYSDIRAFDCEGQKYGYFARHNRHWVKVKMDPHGMIISEQKVRF
jgi:hypothetical protein